MRLTFAPLRGHELPIDMVTIVLDPIATRWRWFVYHKASVRVHGEADALSGAQRDSAAAIADIAADPKGYPAQHDLTLCAEPLCTDSAALYLRLHNTLTVRGFCPAHIKRDGRYGPDDTNDNYEDVTAEAIEALAAPAPGGSLSSWR